MKTFELFLISAVAIGAASPSLAATCRVDHYNFVFGIDVQANMTVKSGQVCTSGFSIRGGGLQSMQVQQVAQHGIAAVSGQRLAYKPNPGYVGQDTFVIRISGETMGRSIHRGDTNIQFSVNVVQ